MTGMWGRPELDPMRNDGAPSLEFSAFRRVARCRRPHTCSRCGGEIKPGSPALRTTCKTSDDRAPWHDYEHVPGDCLRDGD